MVPDARPTYTSDPPIATRLDSPLGAIDENSIGPETENDTSAVLGPTSFINPPVASTYEYPARGEAVLGGGDTSTREGVEAHPANNTVNNRKGTMGKRFMPKGGLCSTRNSNGVDP